MSDELAVCPNCSIEFPESESGVELTSCPACQHSLIAMAEIAEAAPAAADGAVDDEVVEEIGTEEKKRAEMRQLLPPKFLIDDPDFQGYRDEEKVLLPDGKGGITSVKRNVVKVQHKGQTFELIALTPAQRRRRQLIWNCIWIGIGILFLSLVLSMI